MGNSIKKEYDRLSITKDIVERQNIIRQFQITGFLDRKGDYVFNAVPTTD